MKIIFISLLVSLFFLSSSAAFVKAENDTVSPSLVGDIVVSPAEIDTTNQSKTLTLTMRITDESAGACILGDCGSYEGKTTQVKLRPAIGGASFIDFVNFTRISGNDKDGVYVGTATVPAGSKEGDWQIDNGDLYIVDKAGNGGYWGTIGWGKIFINIAENSLVKIERNWALHSSEAIALFSEDTTVTRADGGNFAFYKMTNQAFNLDSVTNKGLFLGSVAGKIYLGISRLNLNFNKSVEITFYVKDSFNGKTLNVQMLKEGGSNCEEKTTCSVSNGRCIFNTDVSGYFVALEKNVTTNTPTVSYSANRGIKKNINYTLKNLSLTKKNNISIRLGGRKVKVVKVTKRGSDSIVTV